MKPFYRLIMRGNDCVGVVAGAAGEASIVIEVSGGSAAVNTFLDSVPGEADTCDHWFDDLLDLLPMTYKMGSIESFTGESADNATAEELAEALAEANISSSSRSSKLVTTRVMATATIEDGGAAGAGSSTEGKLKRRPEDDETVDEQVTPVADEPVEEPAAEVDADAAATEENVEPAPEPAAPAPVAPPVVIVTADPDRPVLSVADDGAGLLSQWFLLLEDWQGFAAVFAGDRDSYAVLSRAATEDMSKQVAQAVPSEAANLEHWVTSLIRKLPAGVWLRAFANIRSLTAAELHTPEELLRAVIDFYGTPSPSRSAEFYGTGAVDGSLQIDTAADAFTLAVVEGVTPTEEPPAPPEAPVEAGLPDQVEAASEPEPEVEAEVEDAVAAEAVAATIAVATDPEPTPSPDSGRSSGGKKKLQYELVEPGDGRSPRR